MQAQLETVREECERKIVMLREGEKHGKQHIIFFDLIALCHGGFICTQSGESEVQRENNRLQGLLEKMR